VATAGGQADCGSADEHAELVGLFSCAGAAAAGPPGGGSSYRDPRRQLTSSSQAGQKRFRPALGGGGGGPRGQEGRRPAGGLRCLYHVLGRHDPETLAALGPIELSFPVNCDCLHGFRDDPGVHFGPLGLFGEESA